MPKRRKRTLAGATSTSPQKLLRKELLEINSLKNNCETLRNSEKIESRFQSTPKESNSPQDHNHPLPIKCLICAREITSGTSVPTDEVSTVTLLCQLFKLLKISPAVCRFALQNTLQPVIYCQSCETTISSGIRILKEVEHLRNSLEVITSKIKEDFIEGYYCRAGVNESFSIRKTLVQCWTTCQVRIKNLPAGSYSKHEDASFEIESKVEGEMPLTIEESNEGLLDVHGGVSVDDFDFDETPCDDAASICESVLPADDFDDLDDSPRLFIALSPSPSPDDFDDKDDGLRSSPVSPLPVSSVPEDTGLNFGPQNLEADVQKFNGADASTVQTNKEPNNTDLTIENSVNLNSRRSLRLRPKVKIPTYCIESDENVSDNGSVYSPDSPEHTEEVQETQSRKRSPTRKVKRKRRQSPKKTRCPKLPRLFPKQNLAILRIKPDLRSQEFPYHCKTCGKGYHHVHSLEIHEKYHQEGSLKFPCKKCDGVFFYSSYQLRKHIAAVHKTKVPDQEKTEGSLESFACSYCDRAYYKEDYRINKGSDTLAITCDMNDCEMTFSNFYIFSYHHENTCFEKSKPTSETSEGSNEKVKTGMKRVYSKTVGESSTSPDNILKPEKKVKSLFKCKLCGAGGFRLKHFLRLHEKRYHGKLNVSCPECDEKFVTINSARVHQIRSHGKPLRVSYNEEGALDTFQCTYCRTEFNHKDFLIDDLSTDPPTKVLRIPLSNFQKPLTDFKAFHWYHRRNCSSRPRLDLGDGLKEPTEKERRRRANEKSNYFDLKTPGFPHKCSICNKTYKLTYEFDEAGQRFITCVFRGCNRRSVTRNGYRKHHAVHHEGVDSTILKCDHCDKEFGLFKSAYLGDDGMRRYKCDFDNSCHKDFQQFRMFWKHHQRHHSDGESVLPKLRPTAHPCRYCGKIYKQAQSCETHEITVHTKDFKYYCEICGLGRPTIHKLKDHLKCHSEERPYKCELCPKTFKVPFQLKSHMNRHNNVRPYVCELCGGAYFNANTLGMHKKQSHKMKPQLPTNFHLKQQKLQLE